jgi:hypothetical protein
MGRAVTYNPPVDAVREYPLELRTMQPEIVAFGGTLDAPAGLVVEITPAVWLSLGKPIELTVRVDTSALSGLTLQTYNGVIAVLRRPRGLWPALRVPAALWHEWGSPMVASIQLRAPLPQRPPDDVDDGEPVP